MSQVIEGHVAHAAALREHLDRWVREVAPVAAGWLGTTAGVGPDGTAVIESRYASAADAGVTQLRPEHAAWWDGALGIFDGPVTIHDCPEVVSYGSGAVAGAAHEVHVIRSGITDPHRHEELLRELEVAQSRVRPAVLGLTVSRHDDGGATHVVYLREPGPQEELWALTGASPEGWRELLVAPRIIVLTEPWSYAPGDRGH